MGREGSWSSLPSSTSSVQSPMFTPMNFEREDHWRHFDNSVNAVSFGFVATAILISMFLVMAIFERFLRPRSSSSPPTTTAATDLHPPVVFHSKLLYPSPKMTVYAKGVSVLMPGEDVPTFLAHPAPVPCPPEPLINSFHQRSPCFTFTSPPA